MRTLRAASLVLAFLAATSLVLGSFAFSAMSAERGVDVSVVPDGEAFVGYEEVSDGAIHPGEETPIAIYTNRFMLDLGEFTVTVSVSNGDGDVELTGTEGPDSIEAGEAEPVNVTVDCAEAESFTLELDAEGSTAGVSVAFTREIDLTCVPKEPQIVGVTYNDAANAQFEFETDDGPGASGGEGDRSAEAVIWQKPTPPKEESDASDLEAQAVDIDPNDPNLRNILAGGGNSSDDEDGEDWKVVAIEFPNQEVAFFHPGWDAGSFDNVETSEGVEVELDEELTAEDVIDKSLVEQDTDVNDG